MANDDGSFDFLGGDHGRDVVDEQAHRIIVDAARLVRKVVATLIDGGDAIARLRQRVHLMAPRIPEVGEAVDQHDERSLTKRRIVNLHAVRIGETMLD